MSLILALNSEILLGLLESPRLGELIYVYFVLIDSTVLMIQLIRDDLWTTIRVFLRCIHFSMKTISSINNSAPEIYQKKKLNTTLFLSHGSEICRAARHNTCWTFARQISLPFLKKKFTYVTYSIEKSLLQWINKHSPFG